MLSKKLKNASESKLSKALHTVMNDTTVEKTGFVGQTKKTSLFKTKSFRLRESDLTNFKNITAYINRKEDRMQYSDSQIIRGFINYFSDNIENDLDKIITYVRTSS